MSRIREEADLGRLLAEIRACRVCRVAPQGAPLPHEPRPVVRASISARVLVVGQAPGTRVHRSGLPFDDPSGDRLRAWMGVSREEFYDESRFAFAPMGFCFPGLDAKGGDLAPRKECAPLWRARLMKAMPNVDLVLLVGGHAQRWHLETSTGATLTQTVRQGARKLAAPKGALGIPLPHPSWRNTGWLRANPRFETDVLPTLRRVIRARLRVRKPNGPAEPFA